MKEDRPVQELAREHPLFFHWLAKGSFIAGLHGFARLAETSASYKDFIKGSVLAVWVGKGSRILLRYHVRQMGRGGLDFDFTLEIDADY